MRLLLDTHVVLWWLVDDPRLRPALRDAIADPGTIVFVSAVSAWEMSIKHALGKLSTPPGLLDVLQAEGFEELPITLADGLTAGALPRHHDDPFDRMLISQALRHDLQLATVDPRMSQYDVRVLAG